MALADNLLFAVRAAPPRAMHVVVVLLAGLHSRVHASGHRALFALARRLLLVGVRSVQAPTDQPDCRAGSRANASVRDSVELPSHGHLVSSCTRPSKPGCGKRPVVRRADVLKAGQVCPH